MGDIAKKFKSTQEASIRGPGFARGSSFRRRLVFFKIRALREMGPLISEQLPCRSAEVNFSPFLSAKGVVTFGVKFW